MERYITTNKKGCIAATYYTSKENCFPYEMVQIYKQYFNNQIKMRKKIALANKSRGNREFFDWLIRVLAVELNVGGKELNPDLILPSWTAKILYKAPNSYTYTFGTVKDFLSRKTIKDLNIMLGNADLKNAGKIKIMNYLLEHTDLTDCHLTALNEFELTNR